MRYSAHRIQRSNQDDREEAEVQERLFRLDALGVLFPPARSTGFPITALRWMMTMIGKMFDVVVITDVYLSFIVELKQIGARASPCRHILIVFQSGEWTTWTKSSEESSEEQRLSNMIVCMRSDGSLVGSHASVAWLSRGSKMEMWLSQLAIRRPGARKLHVVARQLHFLLRSMTLGGQHCSSLWDGPACVRALFSVEV